MRKPLHIWIIFLACFGLLTAAMAYVGWHTLALEKERETAARDADQQERVRLALWRLDFQASALMMRENARPPQDFRPFHAPAGLVDKSYGNVAQGEVLVPSSVLAELPEHVQLHFQMDSRGQVTSPQVPQNAERALALDQFVNADALQRSEQRLKQLRELLAKPATGISLAPPESVSASRAADVRRSASSAIVPAPVAAPPLNRQVLAQAACLTQFEIEEADPALAATFNNDASQPRNAAWSLQQGQVTQQQSLYNGLENASRSRAVIQQNAEAVKQQPSIKFKDVPAAPIASVEKALAVPEEKQRKESPKALAKEAGAKKPSAADKSKIVASQEAGKPMSEPVPSPAPAAASAPAAALPTNPNEAKPAAEAGTGAMVAASRASSQAAASAPAAATASLPVEGSSSATVALMPAPAALSPEAAASSATKKTLALGAGNANAGGFQAMPPPPPGAKTDSTPAHADASSKAAGDDSVATRRTNGRAAADSSRPFQGVWLGENLVLTREAVVDGVRIIQGVWLDWPALRAAWLREITDLFPDAKLEPAANATADSRPTDDPLRFAALPVRLLPTLVELPPLPFWTPLRRSLGIALACVLLAGAAVGLVLYGTVALSERRAAFVSAVTHELRTPLTTFRLYSEMLADGMVQDEAQRQTYLATLSGEAGRLSHLVENVLAYARLERGSGKARAENIAIGALLDRILPRLQQRADDCRMEVRVHATEEDRKTELHIDAAAVEQILFNLVDNACKYAAPRAAEPVIHVEADTRGKFAMLRVRDHGGGIARGERRRIFHPFHKSADQAAHSAPGVGLGLALCRRLATALGGAITLDAANKDGACFVLRLPK